MSTPAVIFLVLTTFSLTSKVVLHGRETRVNFFFSCIDTAIGLGLLTWGGFFS
jgi:hypothetical protein